MKHPDDLQDRDILMNLDAHRGIGVQLAEDLAIQKRQGELPIAFIVRVKGEYRAWFNRKEAEKAREARAIEASNRAQDERPVDVSASPSRPLQGPQAGLGETVRSQISSLEDELVHAVAQIESHERALAAVRGRVGRVERELALAAKFLKELQEGEYITPVPSEMGRDLHKEVGPRKSKRSARMGPANGTQVGSDSGEGRSAEDQGSPGEGPGT